MIGWIEYGLRGVTSKEMVAGLLGGELRNGREDTEGITSQHDDVTWLVVDHAWDLSIRDELDGICATSVLSNADIVIVGCSRDRVVNNVLQDTAEANGAVDLWLLFGGKVDSLGVASTFNVEDTLIGPDVLIITNKLSSWVSRESSLASTRETEEESNIALLHSDVCRRVEGKLSELDWLQVVLKKEAN